MLLHKPRNLPLPVRAVVVLDNEAQGSRPLSFGRFPPFGRALLQEDAGDRRVDEPVFILVLSDEGASNPMTVYVLQAAGLRARFTASHIEQDHRAARSS